ncbi:MAG: primase C-terminal domain-containing protein, partial [Rhabdochlamydiaceae bacterium]
MTTVKGAQLSSSTPEGKARANIDKLLDACGWKIQDYKDLDLSAGPGVALREVPMKTGEADYLLFVDRKAVGVIEAKTEGTPLGGVAEQSSDYIKGIPDNLLVPIEKAARVYHRCVEMVERDRVRLRQAVPPKPVKSIEKLPVWVRKGLDNPVREGRRNYTVFQLSTAMAQFGIDKELALPAIMDYASRCYPPLDRSEATGALESAYHGVEECKYSVSPQIDAFREFADLTCYISLEAEERASSIIKDSNVLRTFIEDTNNLIVKDERVRRNLLRLFASAYTEDPSNYGLPGPPGI